MSKGSNTGPDDFDPEYRQRSTDGVYDILVGKVGRGSTTAPHAEIAALSWRWYQESL